MFELDNAFILVQLHRRWNYFCKGRLKISIEYSDRNFFVRLDPPPLLFICFRCWHYINDVTRPAGVCVSTTTPHSDVVQVYNYTFCLYGQFHNCNLSTGNYCIYEEKLILRVEANQKRYHLSLWKNNITSLRCADISFKQFT